MIQVWMFIRGMFFTPEAFVSVQSTTHRVAAKLADKMKGKDDV